MKATIVKGNKVVATADSVKEAQAYAKKVGGKVLVPAGGARKNGASFTSDNWAGTATEIETANKVLDRWIDRNPGADRQDIKTASDKINNAFNGEHDSVEAVYRRAFTKPAGRKNGAESVAAVIKAAGASIKKRPLPADLCRKLLKADGYRSIPSDLSKLRMEAFQVLANHAR